MTSSSAIPPSEQLNLIPTAAESSESAPPTDGSPSCACTKETFGCSIHPNTPAEWIASMQGFLVSLIRSPACEQAKMMNEIYGQTQNGSLANYDQNLHIWKMCQASFLTDTHGPSSETLPRWGMTRAGQLFPLPTLDLSSNASGGGASLPAPTRSWGKRGPGLSFTGRKRYGGGKVDLTLAIVKKIGWRWPARLLERMMMWPTDYTALRRSAMDKIRSKPHSPGESSGGRE